MGAREKGVKRVALIGAGICLQVDGTHLYFKQHTTMQHREPPASGVETTVPLALQRKHRNLTKHFPTFGIPQQPHSALGSQPFTLSREAETQLTHASMQSPPHPLHLQGSGKPASDYPSLRRDWESFISHHPGSYKTNGVLTDAPKEVNTQRTGVSLHEAWRAPYRIETQLDRHDDGSPVHEWLWSTRSNPLLLSAGRLEATLHRLATCCCGGQCEILRPSFITGCIFPGGGPTHYDNYNSWALLLVGYKSFYVLAPEELADATSGEPNQHPLLDPSESQLPWRRYDLRPGDVFFLPAGWWHYVVSTPHCVMTNIWAFSS